MLNNNVLPQNIDLLLTEFAGGASGFPQMFHEGPFTHTFIHSFIQTERKKLLRRIATIAKVMTMFKKT